MPIVTFDQEVGLPESMAEKPRAASWLETVEAYVAMKWPGAAAKSRASMIDALVCVTAALVDDRSGGPDLAQLRDALRNFVLPPNVRHLVPPSDTAAAAAWLREASLPLTELGSAVTVRAGLDALALKLDGTAAAATTFRRR